MNSKMGTNFQTFIAAIRTAMQKFYLIKPPVTSNVILLYHIFRRISSAWLKDCRKQHLSSDYWGYVWTVGFTVIKPKGRIQMIHAMYNYRQGEIHSAGFSDDFNKLCISFEEFLTKTQLTTFHKLLDCVSKTAAAEMRAAYKAGFRKGVTLMKAI